MNFIDDNYSGDIREWKFVGLTQRSYRRSWINLPSMMNEELLAKVSFLIQRQWQRDSKVKSKGGLKKWGSTHLI